MNRKVWRARARLKVTMTAMAVLAEACALGFDGDQYTHVAVMDADAETDGGSSVGPGDAAADATPRACAVDVAFGAPVPVFSQRLGDEESGITLFGDQLDGVVSFTSGGQKDLFAIHRDALTAPFVVGEPLSVNTAGDEEEPSITADGLILFFQRVNPNPSRLLVTSRATVGAAWSTPAIVSSIVTADGEAEPHLSLGRLYYLGIYAQNGALFAATRTGTGISPRRRITELDTNDNEHSPVPSSDDLVLYFARQTSGDPRDYEIMVAKRPSPDAFFSTPRPVDELNSTKVDMPRWLSPDGCTVYLVSSRDGAPRLYVAQRTPRE